MATQTSNFSLYKPEVGGDEDTWGTLWNFNADTLDLQLNALSVRIDTNANSVAAVDSSITDTNANVLALTGQINALQQADQNHAVEYSALVGRMSSAETKITQLQNTPSSGGASLSTGSITSTYLADDAVTPAKLADDAVTTAAIETAAVTSDSIANSNVLNRHIADYQITESKLAVDSITSTHIQDNAIGLNHILASHTVVPKPGAGDGDKILYNDDNYGLMWKRQARVTKVTKYTDLFANNDTTEPGDLLIVLNGGSAGGTTGSFDYPVSFNNEATPTQIYDNSVFLANVEAPSAPSGYTTLYTGFNGVVNVDTSDPLRAVFELADGSSYTVNLPQFSIQGENEITGSGIAANDYLAIYDRSSGSQKKIQLQELGVGMSWGSTVIQSADGTGIINTLGIILGFTVEPESGALVMESTGGFTSSTAYIDSSGDFILVG